MSKRKYKYMDKNILTKINHLSETIYHYNRTIIPEAIEALPDEKMFPIIFSMIHEHRAGEPCEPHMRTMLAVPRPGETEGLDDRMFLDIAMEFYEVLPEIEIPEDEEEEESVAS